MSEPQAKRRRLIEFDAGADALISLVPDTRSDAEHEEAEGVDAPACAIHEEYVCNGKEATIFVLVIDPDLRSPRNARFHPAFVHQVFDADERVRGYIGLRITVYIAAASLHTYCRVEWDAVWPEASERTDVQGALERALCHGRLTNEDAFVAHVRSCRGPAPGELVGSYRDPKEEVLRVAGLPVVAKEAGPPEYQVRHAATAKDPVALEHHSRFQQLSLFFIETASTVDLSDTRWRVLTVYGIGEGGVPVAVGYITLYTFCLPFASGPEPAVSLRLCQALLLPPSQRQGHGRVLLHHAWAIVDREQARELTVEDPNEDFCTLRDTVDLERVGLCEPTLGAVPIVAELQRRLRMTVGQARRCVEALRLGILDAHSDADDEARKQFRLSVKRRLLRESEEAQAAEAEERKRVLAELYEDCEREYRVALARSAWARARAATEVARP